MASSALNGGKNAVKKIKNIKAEYTSRKNRKDKDEKANEERIKRTKQGADPKVDQLDVNPPENR